MIARATLTTIISDYVLTLTINLNASERLTPQDKLISFSVNPFKSKIMVAQLNS